MCFQSRPITIIWPVQTLGRVGYYCHQNNIHNIVKVHLGALLAPLARQINTYGSTEPSLYVLQLSKAYRYES